MSSLRTLDDYTMVFRAWVQAACAMSVSKAHFIEGLGYQAEHMLTRMEVNALMPDSACFSYAIQTWCNSACRNELTQKEIYEEAGKGS